MMFNIEEVLEYWFGAAQDSDSAIAERQAGLWWQKNPAHDKQIRQRFAGLLAKVAGGEYDAWAEQPLGRLVLIIITDQLPRNIYRDSATCFGFDHLARRWCKAGLAEQMDQQLRPIHRLFFYLPLEHSEDLQDQQQCVALFERLAQVVPHADRVCFEGFTKFAQQHRDIIARFGRFPHRNALLGRDSTAEEKQFLTQPGSGF